MEYYCLAIHPESKKPTYVHSSFESAASEAGRLSKKLKCNVIILEKVAEVQLFEEKTNGDFAVCFKNDGSKKIVTPFDEKDDLPF